MTRSLIKIVILGICSAVKRKVVSLGGRWSNWIAFRRKFSRPKMQSEKSRRFT